MVGRLAARHGIRVQLRQSETGGVSAFVRIPIDVLANRFDPRADENGGPPPLTGNPADGRPGRPNAMSLPPGGPGAVGPVPPRPMGPGPATDLPRRSLGRPDNVPPTQPPGPGSAPLPRRTPASAGGGDGASAGGVDGLDGMELPVNGSPVNGIPTGRPMLPPANQNPNGNGHSGAGAPAGPPGGSGVERLPSRPQLPGRGGPDQDTGSGPRPIPPLGGVPARPVPAPFGGPAPTPAGLAPAPLGGPLRRRSATRQFSGSPAGGPEERTPIFEQLQSEWFRQRPAAARPAAQAHRGHRRPAAAAPQQAAAGRRGDPGGAAGGGPGRRGGVGVPGRRGLAGRGAAAAADQRRHHPRRPADAGPAGPPDARWSGRPRGRAARAGPPAYRSPEAVRSRLASYHQGVRRGRHADRADGVAGNDSNGEHDPSEVLVQQSQEPS